MVSLENVYLSAEEYRSYFIELGGVRRRLAKDLSEFGVQPRQWVLDVCSGHGFLAWEVAKLMGRGGVVGIGLHTDVESSKNFLREENRHRIVSYIETDSTTMPFSDGSFDTAVNFLGLEDVNMTRGKLGVRKTIGEMIRAVKTGGLVEIALNINGEEEDEVLNEEISRFIGHNAFFYRPEFYIQELERRDAEILDEKWYYTDKKMTAEQAREELRYACEMTPKVYSDFGVSCKSLEEVWNRFGDRIERHGLALYSDILAIFARKK
jgi:ubiquinone/menaquinone biosynthesis C-methylase UbiE